MISVRRFKAIDKNIIGKYEMKQNCCSTSFKYFTLKEYNRIHGKITYKDDTKITLSKYLLLAKNLSNQQILAKIE